MNNFRTLYAHLDKNSVPRNLIGSNVEQGTIIGQLYGDAFPFPFNKDGDCGTSTGSHLHLELPSQYITVDGWTVQGGEGIFGQKTEQLKLKVICSPRRTVYLFNRIAG